MKNPLLTIIALLVLAGVLFAQSFPPGGGAHPIIRKIELVGPIQVEGIVPLRDHISIPWAVTSDSSSLTTPFEWTCPEGMHARVTMISDDAGDTILNQTSYWRASLILATGEVGYMFWGSSAINIGVRKGQPPLETVLHPEDTLRIDGQTGISPNVIITGILQLAVEYD